MRLYGLAEETEVETEDIIRMEVAAASVAEVDGPVADMPEVGLPVGTREVVPVKEVPEDIMVANALPVAVTVVVTKVPTVPLERIAGHDTEAIVPLRHDLHPAVTKEIVHPSHRRVHAEVRGPGIRGTVLIDSGAEQILSVESSVPVLHGIRDLPIQETGIVLNPIVLDSEGSEKTERVTMPKNALTKLHATETMPQELHGSGKVVIKKTSNHKNPFAKGFLFGYYTKFPK